RRHRGLDRGSAHRRGGRRRARPRRGDQHQAPGTRCAPAGLPARPTYPPLVEHLQKVLDGRSSRVPAMLERLRELGIDVDIADVRRAADGAAATGRPHVADALVSLGVVPDRTTAFELYLNPGRPAYVNRYAPPLVEMVRIVDEAGGVSVLAHPWGRHGPES